MTLTAYRIVKAKYVASGVAAAFDGEGARRTGGRWNPVGIPMVYTSQHASLAVLEMLVHLDAASVLLSYALCPVSFDADLVSELDLATLPANWSQTPAPFSLQALGAAWVRDAATPVFRVPSAVVFGESNFLLNPRHPDFARLQFAPAQPFGFDARLKS